jgi:thioredoxin-dependent peroxiredoxin
MKRPPSSLPSFAVLCALVISCSKTPPNEAPVDPMLGKPAPDFSAVAHDGTPIHLAALKGKPVALFFYAKDEAPGGVKEASLFRDSWDGIAKTGAVMIGVSADGLDTHKRFAERYKLPYLLISDPDGSIGRLYGVPFESASPDEGGPAPLFIKQPWHHRSTFVIGADGRVRKAYRTIDITAHARQVVDDLGHAG